jgi:RNA polymerase sigma-70 factor, ECF subfamily
MNRDLTAASDTALVLAIGRWDQDALGELYRRHGGAVFGLAKRVLRDRALSEEIVQEVFLRLWDSPDRFDPERGSLRSFLLAQTHSRSIDMIRSDTARRRREEKDHRRQPEERPDIEHEVWDLVVGEHVKEAVGALPDAERDAIELAYFGGHSYREVALLLDTPEGTVKSRIRSGLQRLREQLVSAGMGEPWQ